jgi:hypothetical protein
MTNEQRERLQAMAAGGSEWDLSDKDRAAIAALLAELGNGERLFDMALVRNRALEEAAKECDERQESNHDREIEARESDDETNGVWFRGRANLAGSLAREIRGLKTPPDSAR